MSENEMGNFINFDTHKYIKELEASGFPEEQAEVLIKSMLATRSYNAAQLATREQVEKLENELKQNTREQVEKLEKELTKFATREQLEKELAKFATREQLQAEIASVKYDILKWIIPMFLGLIGMMVSIFIKLH
jgi:hypothetical protein